MSTEYPYNDSLQNCRHRL